MFEQTRAAYFNRQLNIVVDLTQFLPEKGRLIFSKALVANSRGGILIAVYRLTKASVGPEVTGIYLYSQEKVSEVVSTSSGEVKKITVHGSPCTLGADGTVIGSVTLGSEYNGLSKPFVFESTNGFSYLENIVDATDRAFSLLGDPACVNAGGSILLSNGYLLRKK